MTNEVTTAGAVGMTATSAGTIVSLLPAVEAWLRVASLATGICVGIVTIYVMWRKRN